MRKSILLLLMVILLHNAQAQRVFFVYFQSEQEQPFFFKMEEKITSSSSTGYLILSRLKDSTYNFSIGFPGNKWPEQHFSLPVKGKDHGYLLKNFGEKGWGLFDLQTLSVQMAINEPVKSALKTEKVPVTPFTDVLARAADDSSLRERPIAIAVKEEKKPEPPVVTTKPEESKPATVEPAVVKTEATAPPVTKTEEPVKLPVINDTVAKTEVVKTEEPKQEPPVVKEEAKPVVYKRSVVTQKATTNTEEGVAIVFIDQHEGGTTDTIQVIIPNPPQAVAEVKEPPKEERKFLEISSDTAATKAVTPPVTETKKPEEEPKVVVPETKPVVTETKPVVVETKPVSRNNCKETATDKDFLSLRKKMAAETDDDDMVDEARKYFKTKCFTTLQMKNLSALFLDDLGKYKFFDLAYIFVSDIENFPSLQSELKNEYYISRFKAMLK